MRLPSWGQSLNLHSGVPASIQPHFEQPRGLQDVLRPTLQCQALPSILQTHLSCRVVLFVFKITDTKFLEAASALCAHQLLLSRYKPKLFVLLSTALHLLST